MMFTSDMIRQALEEDIGHGDITTAATVSPTLQGVGTLKAKEPLVLCGTGIFGAVFSCLDPNLRVEQFKHDGEGVTAGTVIMEVRGKFAILLQAERVALNFVQRLSGIATLTRQYVNHVHGAHTKILDTRKTTPLYRHLEKYAVKTGGGVNHRLGLYDEILIKDNHIAACNGSIEEAIRKTKEKFPTKKVVVEVASSEQVRRLLSMPVDRFLLDNMDDAEVAACVALTRGKTLVEVSGGVTLDRVEKLSRLGVDYISVGAMTHSARAVDLNFKISLSSS